MSVRFRRRVRFAVRSLGVHAPRYLASYVREKVGQRRLVRIMTPLSRYPVYARLGTSDLDVFWQVFLLKQYRVVSGSPAWIIDCGANVGYTAAYLATRFPDSRILAVEADSNNAALAQRNLAPYGEQVTLVPGAVWSQDTQVSLVRGEFRDGREWASQTKPLPPNDTPGIPAFSIDSLVAQFGFPRIDLLKVDIEGAEEVLFSPPAPGWLAMVHEIVIELHGRKCEKAFYSALKQTPGLFRFKSSGELILATRLDVSAHRRSGQGGRVDPTISVAH